MTCGFVWRREGIQTPEGLPPTTFGSGSVFVDSGAVVLARATATTPVGPPRSTPSKAADVAKTTYPRYVEASL